MHVNITLIIKKLWNKKMYNNINEGLMITAMTITEARKKIASLEDTTD